jgi:hypothetical protein
MFHRACEPGGHPFREGGGCVAAHGAAMTSSFAIASHRLEARLSDGRAAHQAVGACATHPWALGRAFDALCWTYSRTGGMVAAEQLVEMMRPHIAQPVSRLARWIVARQVVSVQWRSRTMLPMFQFDRRAFCIYPGVLRSMGELGEVFDDWDLATWFASPNSCLGDAVPADCIAARPDDVWQAARMDRYIATGG